MEFIKTICTNLIYFIYTCFFLLIAGFLNGTGDFFVFPFDPGSWILASIIWLTTFFWKFKPHFYREEREGPKAEEVCGSDWWGIIFIVLFIPAYYLTLKLPFKQRILQ